LKEVSLREVRQKVRDNFYQIAQHVIDRMEEDAISTDELRHAIVNGQIRGRFESRYKDTVPGYEGSEGYVLWGRSRSGWDEITVHCQILDSGKLRIIDIDIK